MEVTFTLCDCWLDGRNGWANRTTFGSDGLLSPLSFFGCGRCFPFLLCVCATLTLFVLFASVFALLSALSLSLYSFFGVSIFSPRSLDPASYSAQFVAVPSPFSTCTDSPSLLKFSDVVLSPYSFTPSQIAELLHTVNTCLVSRFNICIS